jgi:FixJ family two-component response regulator
LIASADAGGTVFVIDDDPSVRRALERQLRTAGFRVETFESAKDYVARAPQVAIACIVTDVRMPGMSGLDLQDSLAQAGRALPMVFITGHGDIPTTVRAMKGGAVNFLPKPFAEREILAAVAEALERSAAIEQERREIGSLRARYEALTAREREVLALVVAGLLNKVIADRLGIQETTIKVHRGRVMEKMGAASLADLVRMGERLGLAPGADPARR